MTAENHSLQHLGHDEDSGAPQAQSRHHEIQLDNTHAVVICVSETLVCTGKRDVIGQLRL